MLYSSFTPSFPSHPLNIILIMFIHYSHPFLLHNLLFLFILYSFFLSSYHSHHVHTTHSLLLHILLILFTLNSSFPPSYPSHHVHTILILYGLISFSSCSSFPIISFSSFSSYTYPSHHSPLPHPLSGIINLVLGSHLSIKHEFI